MHLSIALAVLAGFLACGLPLWPIPYREVSLPGNPPPALWLAAGAVAGAFARLRIRRGAGIPVLAVTAGFVLAVLARVAVEVAADPTSHNLWPFEVVIAGFFGVTAALLGVGGARLAEALIAGGNDRR